MGFNENFNFQYGFSTEIKEILGRTLFVNAPFKEDVHHATDFMVFTIGNPRVACRIRRSSYYPQYAGDFTIRSESRTGVQTEIDKIVSGWGDYMLYGFGDAETQKLISWKLADLKIFRYTINKSLRKNNGIYRADNRSNGPGDTKFLVFKWADFPKSMIMTEDPVSQVMAQYPLQ